MRRIARPQYLLPWGIAQTVEASGDSGLLALQSSLQYVISVFCGETGSSWEIMGHNLLPVVAVFVDLLD